MMVAFIAKEKIEEEASHYLAEKRVEINEDILPDNDKRCTGVFNFTLGHEGGHYVLHARLLAANDQNVICRKNEDYLDREWQANFFASSLLMPREPFIKVLKHFMNFILKPYIVMLKDY